MTDAPSGRRGGRHSPGDGSGVDPEGRMPLIGITGRRFPAPLLYPVDAAFMAELSVDGYLSAHAEQVRRAGGTPVYLSRDADPGALMQFLDAVVLSGGLDLDPALYGAVPGPGATAYDREQDCFDLGLARAALAAKVPLLGCCRGHEVLNVACGGTLLADLPSAGISGHNVRDGLPTDRQHLVHTTPDSMLRRLLGDKVRVNTLHHQAVGQVGAGLSVVARTDDGVIEGIEHEDAPAIGVQWHPEMHDAVDPMFAWLVAAARAMRDRGRCPSEF